MLPTARGCIPIVAETVSRALMVAFAGSCLASTASAQADVYTHVEHVAVAFQGAPGGMGLLPTALSEAETAERHARLAAADSVSLAVWRLHAGHVLSALDPARVSGVRQGLGYGVRRAASEAASHMEILLSADSLPESMGIHAPRIFSALNSAVQRTDEATAVAQDILSAPSVTAARPLVGRLESLCEAILWGRDANEDGIAGWEQGEGGLAQAKYHMNLLRRAEGLGF